jgi:hypothetical protein
MDKTREKWKTEIRNPDFFKKLMQIPERKRKACLKFKRLKQKNIRKAIRE